MSPSPPPPQPTHTIHLIPPPPPSILPLARQLCLPPSTSSPSVSNPSSTTSSPQQKLPPHFPAAIQIRIAVFVHEQNCSAEEEIDDDDARSWHWVLYSNTTPTADDTLTPTPAATIRLVPIHGTAGAATHWAIRPGWGHPNYAASSIWDGREGYVKIGRLATVREARGQGLGRVLVETVVEWVRGNWAVVGRAVGPEWKGLIGCHAQSHLEGWYRKMGFVRDAGMGEWEEDGIPHVGMWRRVEV